MQLDDVSSHFTRNVLDEIVQKDGGIKCTDWSFGSGFNKGDSYLSNQFRMTVVGVGANGESVETKVVIKALPKNAARRKLFRSDVFFRNEINFYTKVLPAFENFQKQRNATIPFHEYPKYLASYCDGVNDFIALEDISATGFGPASRQGTVDVDHCSLIMKGLGRFHAVSLAFNDQQPEEYAKVTQFVEETYYSEKFRNWYAPFMPHAILVANDAVSKEFPNTEYERKTKEFLNGDVFGNQIDLVSRKNKFSVIQHGDCWMPNFLIRYDAKGNPEQVKILDFQLARYASPAVDLSFFMYSCTDSAMRNKSYDTMLKVYHEAASKLIKDLGSDPEKVYPYESLLNEMKEVAKFGCGMGIESLPLSMKSEDDIADLDQVTSEDAILTDVWKISPLTEKADRLRIAEVFKHAIDMKYI